MKKIVVDTLENVIKRNIPLNFDRRSFLEHCMKNDNQDGSRNQSRDMTRNDTRVGSKKLIKKKTNILKDKLLN